MNKLHKTPKVMLGVALVLGLAGPLNAATTVNLATAGNFAVLGSTAVTNTPTSVITGDVGLTPASGSSYSGITLAQITGTLYATDGAGPSGAINNPGLLTVARNDLTAAYIDAAGRTPTSTFVAGDNQLGGQTLTAGVYAFGHASTANITASSPLTLDAQGDPSAVFIFQASSDLVTASSSVVQLINGAQACNVFWQVTSSTTLGTNSTFVGTIMSLTASTLTTGVQVAGRVMARNAAITLDSNTITRPTCAATTSGSTPALPNAGTGTSQRNTPWGLIALTGIVTVSGLTVITRRKKLS